MYMTVLMTDKDRYINAKIHEDIFDGDAMHGLLTGCLGDDRMNASLLYRIMDLHDAVYLYIQSKMPFPAEKIEEYGFVKVSQAEISPIFESKKEGSSFSFNVCAVPMKKYIDKDRASYLTKDADI